MDKDKQDTTPTSPHKTPLKPTAFTNLLDEIDDMGKKKSKADAGNSNSNNNNTKPDSSNSGGSSKIPTPAPSKILSDTTAVSNNVADSKTTTTASSSEETPTAPPLPNNPQAPIRQALPNSALVGKGSRGNAADVPATPIIIKYEDINWSSKSSEEIAKEYEQLLQAYTKLKRDYERLETKSNIDYDSIAQLQEENDVLKNDLSTVQEAKGALERRNEQLQGNKEYFASLVKDQTKPLKSEQDKHRTTKENLNAAYKKNMDLEQLNKAIKADSSRLLDQIIDLQKEVAEKEALLAGADEQYVKMQEELQTTRDQAEQNQDAHTFLDIVNKDLESSFATIGKDLTPQNLVKRFRELEQQESPQPERINRGASGTNLANLNRNTSGTSINSREADFGKPLPKHRPSGDRTTSLGDELNRATSTDDDQSNDGYDEENTMTEADFAAKFDDSHIAFEEHNKAQSYVQDHGLYKPERDVELLFHPEPPMRNKSTSTDAWEEGPTLLQAMRDGDEKAKRIKALEKELAARPASGDPTGTVAAPAAREKLWWEVLLGASWWVKLLLLLCVLLWATATIGAIHERQRWVWANVTPEMVRFYASPPTLGGLLGSMAGQGSGVMFG